MTPQTGERRKLVKKFNQDLSPEALEKEIPIPSDEVPPPLKIKKRKKVKKEMPNEISLG